MNLLDNLTYYLKKHKPLVLIIGLALFQLVLLTPLLREISTPFPDITKLEKEAALKKQRGEAPIFRENVSLPYWSEPKRNIFVSRKKGALATQKEGTEIHLLYVGTFRTEKVAKAMIKDKATGKNYFKQEGDTISGHKIISIKKEALVLQGIDGRLINIPKGRR